MKLGFFHFKNFLLFFQNISLLTGYYNPLEIRCIFVFKRLQANINESK